ncbi:MAG: CBS domain-containing protein [Bdellovibrionales bacterium]|nr:CBS domain-containing protein [Bdellovibrionales bacterium]
MSDETHNSAAIRGRVFASGLCVRDMMTTNVRTLSPSDTLQDLADLLERHHIRHAPLVDKQGKLVGLVTQRDLLLHSMPKGKTCEPLATKPLKAIMQDSKFFQVRAIAPETSARSAAIQMSENKIGCLPVTDRDGKLVGILTEGDFVRFFADGEGPG